MTTTTATGAGHLPSLDGLRALSFLIVFAAHAGARHVLPGGFGVTVFFFLSGYLITTRLREEREAHGAVSFKRFYLRRALRILPPFYVVLALAVAAAASKVLPGGVEARTVLAQALHAANYWIVFAGDEGQAQGTGVYWSLAVEEHYYAIFPWLYVALARFLPNGRKQGMALWGLCALVLAWRAYLVLAAHVPENRTYLATDTRADSILFGCALALVDNPACGDASSFHERIWKWVLFPASVVLLLVTFLVRAPAFRETLRYSLQGIALTPVFVVALRYPSWAPCRLLNGRLMGVLGTLSYPLYLVHHVLLMVLDFGPLWARAMVALAASLLVAWTIHEVVEKPCARLRARLESKSLAEARPEGAQALAVVRST
jgi:peptidoglycan/LPS O-acetylase OafA/YrhL